MAAGHGFSTDVGEYHEPYIWSWIIGSSAGVTSHLTRRRSLVTLGQPCQNPLDTRTSRTSEDFPTENPNR